MSLIDWLMSKRPGAAQKQQREQGGAAISEPEPEEQLIVITEMTFFVVYGQHPPE